MERSPATLGLSFGLPALSLTRSCRQLSWSFPHRRRGLWRLALQSRRRGQQACTRVRFLATSQSLFGGMRSGTQRGGRIHAGGPPVVSGGTISDIAAEFLEPLNGLDLGVKAVYLARSFYNSTCLGLLYAHNYAYAMPVVKWGETIQTELSKGWTSEINHDLASEVTFPVFIDCVPARAVLWTVRGTSRLRR